MVCNDTRNVTIFANINTRTPFQLDPSPSITNSRNISTLSITGRSGRPRSKALISCEFPDLRVRLMHDGYVAQEFITRHSRSIADACIRKVSLQFLKFGCESSYIEWGKFRDVYFSWKLRDAVSF